MATREERQKELERIHLDSFLELSGRSSEVEPFERPDFILTGPDGRYGVEVTYLLKRENAHGSAAKREEKHRAHFLNSLARRYYSSNEKPLRVQAVLPALPSGEAVDVVAGELRSQTAKLEPWATAELLADYRGETYQLFVRALPDRLPRYSHWECINDIVGWVETIQPELLVEKIKAKAASLSEYRRSIDRVVLLIVADRTRNSGKYEVDPSFQPIDAMGFEEVHLLQYPLEAIRIA